MNKRILVALSGGIDSASVAMMLVERGFSVEALYIDMTGESAARHRAIELAERLAITLHIEDVQGEFRAKVVNFVLDEHRAGRTPSPCAVCNPTIKWATLATVADRLGIFHIATGHYVRIVNYGELSLVARGIDPIKDQSYYLYSLPQSILSRAITPLGDFFKKDIRQYLVERGFDTLASGGESMGLCFMQGRSYADFLRSSLANSVGEVVDINGAVIGSHDGYALYTVGQKRGFTSNIGGEVRLMDASTNRLVVGEPLYADHLVLSDFVLHTSEYGLCEVMVRGLGRNPHGEARIEIADGQLHIYLLSDRAWAPCPGQPVVLYHDDSVVGGGIERFAKQMDHSEEFNV